MASLKGLTRRAVEDAIREFDAIGQRAFLNKYGFGEAKGFYLVHNGRRYDSKAITGAAMGRVTGRSALTSGDFTGGLVTVVRALKKLGFDVVDERPRRNPGWSTEEIILALDVYLTHGALRAEHPRVVQLSAELNALDVHAERPDAEKWRNPNGAGKKLANFAHLDPAYQGRGLDAGSKLDRRVWDLLSPYPDLVQRLAEEVRIGSRIDLDRLPATGDHDLGEPVRPAPSTRATATSAPVEGHHTRGRYEVTAPAKPTSAERLEQPLVHRFCRFLEAGGYLHERVRFTLDGTTFSTDLVVEPADLLFEAKFKTHRDEIRSAVGQLKDYDFMREEATGGAFSSLAVLLGRRPTHSTLRYLKREGIGAAWAVPRGFAATPDVLSMLGRCDWLVTPTR